MSAAPLKKSSFATIELTDASEIKATENSIAVSQDLVPAEVLRQALVNGHAHICQRGGHEFDKEIQASEALLQNPELLLTHPVSTIFAPSFIGDISERKLTVCDERFDSSGQKRAVLGTIVKTLESKGLSQTLIEDVTGVADEMFTNAVFNAPFIDSKTHMNPGISRHNFEVKLAPGKVGRLILAADSNRLLIGCEDPFGSLSLVRYLTKIKATYDHGAAATMNFGPGGAGLGSYIIFNTGCSLYAGVWPGRATMLCCVLPLGMSNRKRGLLPKNIHVIQS